MALSIAFPGPSGLVDAVALRKDLAGLITRDAAGVARAGVFPRHTNALVTSRASMGVDVASFEAALVRGGGPLFISNDGTVTVPIGAAPSSNSRYDIVYVKQNESAAPFADASNSAAFGFVSGTAAASPSLSAALALVPAGGLPLAAVLVPSTATTTQSAGVTISQVFPYTALTGVPVWVRNQTERDASTWGFWQTVHRLDSGITEQYLAADTGITPNRPQGWYPIGEKKPSVECGTSGSVANNSIPALTIAETREIGATFNGSGTTLTLPPLHGWWRLEHELGYASNSTGGRINAITVDGTTLGTNGVANDARAAFNESYSTVSKEVLLAGGNTIRAFAGNTSGVTLAANGTLTATYVRHA